MALKHKYNPFNRPDLEPPELPKRKVMGYTRRKKMYRFLKNGGFRSEFKDSP